LTEGINLRINAINSKPNNGGQGNSKKVTAKEFYNPFIFHNLATFKPEPCKVPGPNISGI